MSEGGVYFESLAVEKIKQKNRLLTEENNNKINSPGIGRAQSGFWGNDWLKGLLGGVGGRKQFVITKLASVSWPELGKQSKLRDSSGWRGDLIKSATKSKYLSIKSVLFFSCKVVGVTVSLNEPR